MVHLIEPVFRMRWNEVEGAYESTGDQIGYQFVGVDGKVWGYGEDPESALQAGYEAMWDLDRSEGGDSSANAVVVAR